jgi:hypothetical protein
MEINMLSYARYVFAPLIIRFKSTEDLEATLDFLDMCDKSKLDERLVKFVDRTQFIIAKELLRRGVRIWEF